jgi:hypothetical protein
MINKVSKIFVIIFMIALICFIVNGYIKKYDVENNGKISIGKYVLYDSWPKGECNYFIFYINGKKYKENGGRAPIGFSENIGKFYKIIYSKKYKGSIQALFDQEVTDTTKILKAGFSKDELESYLKKE